MIRLRNFLRRIGRYFPPNWWLAALVAIDGYLFVRPVLGRAADYPLDYWLSFDSWRDAMDAVGLLQIPRVILGAGLLLMAAGLVLKARIAWAFSLVLLGAVGVVAGWDGGHGLLLAYTGVLIAALVCFWRRFDRASLAAGSLFALISITSLLIYAVFGTLYLGAEFSPKVESPATAFYFSIVSMSTVGYGDITPQTTAARLFAASIIILGITVFATSISAIAGPVIGGNLKRLVRGRISHAMRKHHIIIAGATPLAQSVYAGMRERGNNVTVVVAPGIAHDYPEDADLVTGDPSNTAVLAEAGAAHARYVLALRDDDADNAFIVLAAKEVAGPDTRTVAVANTAMHLAKIRRVQPDMVFSLQLLGAELLARTLSGETIDNALVTDLFFTKATPAGAA